MSTRVLQTTIGALCTIAAGYSLLIISVVFVFGLPARPRQAYGTIVDYKRELTGRSLDSLRYFPIVNYTNSSGVMASFSSWTGLMRPKYPTGTVVGVIYFPSEWPKQPNAEIVCRESMWAARAWWFWLSAVMAFVFIIPLVVVAYAFLNGRSILDVIRV